MPSYRIVQLGNTDVFRVEQRVVERADNEREWQTVSFAEDQGHASLGSMDYSGWKERFDTEDHAEAAAIRAWGASGSRDQEWRVV